VIHALGMGLRPNLIRLKSISDDQDIAARKRFKKGINISNALVIIIGFVGTLVWGYGDLIYKSIN